jgi:hypothetical protein
MGAFLQAGESSLAKGMDGFPDGLAFTQELCRDLRGGLLIGAGEQDLGSLESERLFVA